LQFLILSQKTIHSSTIDTLGKVIIDLTEFSQTGKITKSFLLKESKLNSTLKVSIEMVQLNGDPFFKSYSPKVGENTFQDEEDEKILNSQNIFDQVLNSGNPLTKSQSKFNSTSIVISPQPRENEKDENLSKFIDNLINESNNEH
jgi:hypothetical protein